ncbi:MAG: hypothetical protein NVSMB51_20750 [Solirubrobacteraceae bacterium]
MIAFGCSISEPEPYRRYAEPGIRRAAEPDATVYAYAAVGSICRSYNLLLDAAKAHADLEALVLVQPEVEITDRDFAAKVRRALSDPAVALVGCAGATGVRSIAWWEGEAIAARVDHRYGELGGGELAGFAWADPSPAPADVETVDGAIMILSPWAVRNLRFDEELTLGHGYDLDYCLRLGAAGRRVRVEEIAVRHHRSLELIGDLAIWTEAHIRMAERWPDLPQDGAPEWKQRARRAEAQREAARAIAYSRALESDARVLELERTLARYTETRSWRLTKPLRDMNKLRERALARRGR